MKRILVTGGTGVLGRQVVQRLTAKADVRVLSRTARPDPAIVQGDLETGVGLAAACAGVDVIVHCAGIHDYLRAGRDVRATRRLLDAAAGTPHIVFISVVGADRVPVSYPRAKLAAEQLLQESGLPVTILRATLFHDLLLKFLKLAARGPVAFAPRRALAQPVDSGEVAARLAELALGEPAGRVADMGGPRVQTIQELMRTYLAVAGSPKPVVPLPSLLAVGMRGDQQLVPAGTHGTVDFEAFLRARTDPDGEVRPTDEPGVSRVRPR